MHHWCPCPAMPGHATPGLALPGRAEPSQAWPRQATPNVDHVSMKCAIGTHALPGPAEPSHALPGQAPPRPAQPRPESKQLSLYVTPVHTCHHVHASTTPAQRRPPFATIRNQSRPLEFAEPTANRVLRTAKTFGRLVARHARIASFGNQSQNHRSLLGERLFDGVERLYRRSRSTVPALANVSHDAIGQKRSRAGRRRWGTSRLAIPLDCGEQRNARQVRRNTYGLQLVGQSDRWVPQEGARSRFFI